MTHEAPLQNQPPNPAEYADARSAPYLGDAKTGPQLREISGGTEQAFAYAQELFPEQNFSLLGSGRYGIVLADDNGKAYKIYRDALNYSSYEREAGAMQLLSEEGLAPKVHMFVDASAEYRLDKYVHDGIKPGFENVQIPRQDSGRELPVLVMDRVDTAPLESATSEQLADGFCKTAEVFLRESIHAWDTEVRVDTQTGNIIMLDVGSLSQTPYDAASETVQERTARESGILRDLVLDFGLTRSQHLILDEYARGGLEAVRATIRL